MSEGNHYEEVTTDYRAKDPALKELKRRMRLQTDRVQCKLMREALPQCLGWERFIAQWKPEDLIITTRKAVRDRAQQLLFDHQKMAFPDRPVSLLYHPRDTRRQNVQVPIPGTTETDELVLNDIKEVPIEAAERELARLDGTDWRLGYTMTVHSTQGLTMKKPQKGVDYR